MQKTVQIQQGLIYEGNHKKYDMLSYCSLLKRNSTTKNEIKNYLQLFCILIFKCLAKKIFGSIC